MLRISVNPRNGPSASDSHAAGPARGGRATGGFFGGSGNVLGSEDDPAPAENSSAPSALPTQPAASGPSGGPQFAAVSPSSFDQLLAGMFGRQGAPPPQPQAEEDEDDDEVQVRNLTFWRNGFSIEDGPLMNYDEPANKEILDAIHAGRAPPALFGVRYNQPLQVVVAQRTQEDYRPPPKKPMKAFGGGGNRLGNSVPEVSTSTGGSGASTPAMPGGFGGGSGQGGNGTAAPAPTFELDTNKPSTSVQIRLGDGTR